MRSMHSNFALSSTSIQLGGCIIVVTATQAAATHGPTSSSQPSMCAYRHTHYYVIVIGLWSDSNRGTRSFAFSSPLTTAGCTQVVALTGTGERQRFINMRSRMKGLFASTCTIEGGWGFAMDFARGEGEGLSSYKYHTNLWRIELCPHPNHCPPPNWTHS